MERQKRVLAIHDISGVGKCSLTVALPIISSVGVETSVMPTAVLSTHTGGFTGFTYRDLTEDLLPITAHWKSLNITFDAIYTGFLGSFQQIDMVMEIIHTLKSDHTKIIVDPVMADHGVLYSIFDKTFPTGMKKLCAVADIIVPNMTEALLMLNEPYQEGPYKKEYIEGLLRRLGAIGADNVVLTGVYFDENALGAACYDKTTDSIDYAFAQKIVGSFHGTGDVFGSVLTGVWVSGKPLREAMQYAVDFTVEAIQYTKDAQTESRYGVNFEKAIPGLIKKLGL